jgi:glycosyltransferase involved in cell wall biosynthesis
VAAPDIWELQQMSTQFRFERPEELAIVTRPSLSVAVVISCRDGQEKLDLVLASLCAQSYPSKLLHVYIIDDGSQVAITIPALAPKNTKIIRYKNSPSHWGKTAATNDCVAKLKEDVLWFVDADMVFEPTHLAEHMKWHHDADDYVVLGWKRFVQEWGYTPKDLYHSLSQGEFHNLHKQSWSKDLWEERINRTDDLRKPALEGYRSVVGATFSIMNSQWSKLGGYNRELITGEDTELGWRIFANGLRTVPERNAHSWHLGFSTVEKNKDLIQRHNDPALAQFIPEMHSIRSRYEFDWKVPTYKIFFDVRNLKLSELLEYQTELLALKGTSAHFTLLGPWKVLRNRYSPTTDEYADLREIHSWLKGDERFDFVEIGSEANLSVDDIIELIEPSSTAHYIFAEGKLKVNFKHLSDYQLLKGEGLTGIVDQEDNRAFVIFGPALARAVSTGGWVYENISQQWGISWLTHERFMQINVGKRSRIGRFFRFIKREGKKVNSPKQLAIFIQKLAKLVLRKVLRHG